MGGFTTNFAGEPVSVQQMTFTIATSSLTATGDSHFTNISLVDENGAVVASGVDATKRSFWSDSSFTDTITFPTGAHSYYLQGKIPSTVTGGSFSVSTVRHRLGQCYRSVDWQHCLSLERRFDHVELDDC
jgi:hypothetical protein